MNKSFLENTPIKFHERLKSRTYNIHPGEQTLEVGDSIYWNHQRNHNLAVHSKNPNKTITVIMTTEELPYNLITKIHEEEVWNVYRR